uniref:CRAL-TRIO domain-containing protein n=1 Tax=Romanomermis culicivorax TaxID=13658 RepID=A0A915JE39_ROMCU
MERKYANAVAELRKRLGELLPKNYDTDFNLLRWLINAEKLTGQKTNNVDLAEKQLRNHLRLRAAMKLDEPGAVPPMAENPLQKDRLIPIGSTPLMPGTNKFLWWTDYKTLDMQGLMKSVKSSDMLLYHFWLYEHLLKLVNDQERKTGQMSGHVCVVDMNDYDFNPLTLLFFNSGQMTHYINVFHYEHYPQLVYPIYAINVPKWLYLAYKMIKVLLPKDINDRVRILDHNFRHTMRNEIDPKELPISLGGDMPDDHLKTIPARKLSPDEYYLAHEHEEDPPLDHCLHLQVNARRRRFLPVECHSADMVIEYFFTSDAELNFAVFFDPAIVEPHKTDQNDRNRHSIFSFGAWKQNQHHSPNEIDTDQMVMIKPPFCVGARYAPERGVVPCDRPGTYYFVFCNKHCWMTRRNVYLHLNLVENPEEKNNNDNSFKQVNLKSIAARSFSTN